MSGQRLVRFLDVDDPDEIEIVRLNLNVLPPVGTEVRIRETIVDDMHLPESVTTRWVVDHCYWHITKQGTVLPGGIGWRYLVAAFVYLKRL